MSEENGRPSNVLGVIKAFTKPLLTDRLLPPVPGTLPEAFEALYARRQDPWGVLASPLAHQRYLAIVEAVAQVSPCRSILDVGCGEGALTRYLVGCAGRVVGIDVSATAVERARRLVPKATFESSSLAAFDAPEAFDVVLAVEMLYYVKCRTAAIEKLLSLGRSVIVSYTTRERSRVEPYLERFCAPGDRRFHSFFGLKRHGFTIARLSARPEISPC